MSSAPSTTLILFARAPLPGRCKTRLARSIGAHRAAKLYRTLLLRCVCAALASELGAVEIWLADRPLHPLFSRLRTAHGVRLRFQPRGTLGARMRFALDRALDGGAARAVLCGTDIVNLEARDFQQADRALQGANDAVLQPAPDGGYVLIGVRSGLGSRLSRGIRWSSGRELAQTRFQLLGRGMQVSLGRMRHDLDDVADLRRARRQHLI